ncbi:MAG: hypothetical protein QME58_14350 [Bacteroidota bacterium]|nr:hypothetical protein [Bacteroidota bacterium]
MKRENHFFGKSFCLLFLLLIANQIYAQGDKLKLFQIQSGIIEYKYSGNEVGKSILYFDNYGNRSAINLDTKEDGEIRKAWIISLGEYQYIFDPSKPNEGFKLKNPMIEWIHQNKHKDVEKFNEETYTKLGMKKAGTEKFLGKECIAYKGNDGKVLTWKGILMLMDSKIAGTHTKQEVTSIKTNIPVDQKYFVIPKSIKFSEMPMFGNPPIEDEEDDEIE